MKLKKINGVYHATYKTATGQRRTISTKQTDHAKAIAVVKESGMAEMEQAAVAGNLTRKVLGRILTGKNMTMTKAIKPFQAWMQSRGRAPKTIEEVTTTLDAWTREAKLEATPPAAITAKQIADWINDPKKERGRATRRIVLGHIHTFFLFCCANGWVVADPSQSVGIDYNVLSHDQKEPGERHPFTTDELDKLIAHLKTRLADVDVDIRRVENSEDYTETGRERKLALLNAKRNNVFFWLFAVRCSSETGLRLSDIAGLEWRCFTEPKKIIVWMDKTNQRIENKLSPALETMVTQILMTDATYLFPEQRAIIKDVKHRALLSVSFTRICERIGIVGKSFHSLRHTAATEQFKAINKDELAQKLAAVLSLEEIKQLLGHASTTTTRFYVH